MVGLRYERPKTFRDVVLVERAPLEKAYSKESSVRSVRGQKRAIIMSAERLILAPSALGSVPVRQGSVGESVPKPWRKS